MHTKGAYSTFCCVKNLSTRAKIVSYAKSAIGKSSSTEDLSDCGCQVPCLCLASSTNHFHLADDFVYQRSEQLEQEKLCTKINDTSQKIHLWTCVHALWRCLSPNLRHQQNEPSESLNIVLRQNHQYFEQCCYQCSFSHLFSGCVMIRNQLTYIFSVWENYIQYMYTFYTWSLATMF